MRLSHKVSRIVTAIVAAGLYASSAYADVFINEIHYDDSTSAGDKGEGVEIVATAGESLVGYKIYLYNGTSTTTAAKFYDNDAISTSSSVTCGSQVNIGYVSYPTNGIQNGANDGIALVNSSGTLVQFLSYEGAITAADGPAAGKTSTNLSVSETNSTAAGKSLQLSGSGSSSANFTWKAPATQTFGKCNNSQTFTAANPAPTITSTTPSNNATGVSPTANLQVAFSESVTLSTGAFALQCATSGAVSLTHSTTGSSFSITLGKALQSAETCALTVTASKVTDSGGAKLAQNTVVNFTVASTTANVAPTVTATLPTNGALTFPPAADLQVNFSEAVSLASGAITLQCTISGNVSLSHLSSATIFLINAATDLRNGEKCTLTVVGSKVTDSEGATLAQNKVVTFTVTGPSSTYYSHVNTSSASQLRCSLNQAIRGHIAYPYYSQVQDVGLDTWSVLEIADEDPSNAANILDAYRNHSYLKGDANYNREHTWPNSLGFPSTTGNLGLPYAPYTDTHMLYLTNVTYNSDRGNKPYADCSGCSERVTDLTNGTGGGSGVYPGNSNWVGGTDGNAGSFQVWGKRKGDMARAVLYMAIRYEGGTDPGTGQSEPDLELTDDRTKIVKTSASPAYMGLLSTLLAWHTADPVDAAERERNEVVYGFQGNRNPFIDHPEWATDALFKSTKPATCTLN